MTLKNRLAKLEAPTVKRWHEAWEQSAVIFEKHAGSIVDIMDTPGFVERLTAARPGSTGDEVEAEAQAFLERLGVTQYRDFETWFGTYEVPEDNPPDLSVWPHTIPTPPDEPPGDWEYGCTLYDLRERRRAARRTDLHASFSNSSSGSRRTRPTRVKG